MVIFSRNTTIFVGEEGVKVELTVTRLIVIIGLVVVTDRIVFLIST